MNNLWLEKRKELSKITDCTEYEHRSALLDAYASEWADDVTALRASQAELTRTQTALGTANATLMGMQDGSLLRDTERALAESALANLTEQADG